MDDDVDEPTAHLSAHLDRVAQGISEGWIDPPTTTLPPSPPPRVRATVTIHEMLDEDRGE